MTDTKNAAQSAETRIDGGVDNILLPAGGYHILHFIQTQRRKLTVNIGALYGCWWPKGNLSHWFLPRRHRPCFDHLPHHWHSCPRANRRALESLRQGYDLEDRIGGNYAGSLLSFKSKGAIMFGLDLEFGNLALLGMVLHFPLTQLTEMLNSTGYSFLAKALCNRSQRYRTRI